MRVRRVVIGLIAGLIVGSTLDAWPGDVASGLVAVLGPVGELWVSAIRMTVVPLVMSLLFVSVASRGSTSELGRVGAVTMAAFFALLAAAAVFAVLLVPPLMQDMKLSASAAEALRSSASADAAKVSAQLPGFAGWLTSLLPTNVVKSAVDGAMLPLILFTLMFGLAARRIESEQRQALVDFFGAVGGAMTRVIEWVVAVAPVGVFALVTVAASKAGIALAGAMLYYVFGISALSLLFALAIYLVVPLVARIPLRDFVRAVFPAQAVAFSSSSSLASLPALVDGARRLSLPPQIGGFVLPLSVASFKVATPITLLTGAVFLARLYGVAIDYPALVTIAITAIALSFTAPGIPQGAQLMLAPLLVSHGIPAEGVALLIAADTIPDLFGTVTNVTGDLVAGTVVARHGASPAIEIPELVPEEELVEVNT